MARSILSDVYPVRSLLMMLMQIYVVTFVVFPGVTNLAELTFLQKDSVWFQIFWITLFNVFDTAGRFLGGQQCTMMSVRSFYVLSIARIIQLPVLVYFALIPQINITTDVLKIINLSLFALGNGYLQTIC